MADRKLMEEYENSVMSLAVSEMLEKFGKELEEEYKNMEDIPPNPEASEKFYKALDKEYRKGQIRSFGKKAARFGRYAITVCAAVIVVFSISVVSVDALRIKFLDWLTNVHSNHNSYNDIYMLNDITTPSYLPDGYKLQMYIKEDEIETQTYINDNNNTITIINNTSDIVFNTDNESIDTEFVKINDFIGLYSQKGNDSSLMWSNDNTSFIVTTDDVKIDKNQIVQIAQSLK
ncbi:DUF4367 domain-containing protein [Huintestinicola sp.]